MLCLAVCIRHYIDVVETGVTFVAHPVELITAGNRRQCKMWQITTKQTNAVFHCCILSKTLTKRALCYYNGCSYE